MSQYLFISDAAKEVNVESHVLRYWEEELRLPIKRNEMGHRYYTKEDVERFKYIKKMKEGGLQLKAIRMKIEKELPQASQANEITEESREDKSKRLQWLLQQLIRNSLRENNEELSQTIRETVVKELDYQFRLQEQRAEERDRILLERNEAYYRKMDEVLRLKSRKFGKIKNTEKKQEKETKLAIYKNAEGKETESDKTKNKKKRRHSFF